MLAWVTANGTLAQVATAVDARPSRFAQTRKSSCSLNTPKNAGTAARTGATLVYVSLAVRSGESGRTVTTVSVDLIVAGSSILTPPGRKAVVWVYFAIDTQRPRRTRTLKSINEVVTRSVVSTGTRVALVVIHRTVSVRKARPACTLEGGINVGTVGTVPARLRTAVVGLVFTVSSLVTRRTRALMSRIVVKASAAITTECRIIHS